MTIFPVDRQFQTQFWQSPPQTFWVPTNLILLSGFCQSAIKVEWKQFIAKGHISLKVGQDWVVQIAPKTHSVHDKEVMALLGNMWKHNSHVLGKIIGWDEPWVQLFFGSFWALGPFLRGSRKGHLPPRVEMFTILFATVKPVQPTNARTTSSSLEINAMYGY